ncbi:hypothetical protein C7212DRAFT_276922 [Tuber magnatum]|uniref:NlpC/P60 domain-containing protein n=1 Tax=Tuber magnatum TaxID=42249 RepID=A0A317SU19_9PEZI|nr:hypothetical protein C7212DRAFT_276922 [Tuber magnatum]
MKSTGAFTFILSLAAAAGASPLEQIFGRAVGDKCTGPEGSGTCQSTSKCNGISYPQPYCPNDPNDIQCCVEISCRVPAGTGLCRSRTHDGCSGGTFHRGSGAPWPCPGSDDIQCCVKSTQNPPGGGGDVGAKILEKALTAAGTPYAWGGGSCNGPSEDQPPYKYGDVGYDCSGLLCWAVCQITGRDLFKAGLRVTHSMYCASDSTLAAHGMHKVDYAQRKVGDAVFFGDKCDCTPGKRDSIHHVGIMMDSGTRMWNAPNDKINKVLESNIATFGEKPCPRVVRFS